MLTGRDLITLDYYKSDEILWLLDLASVMKRHRFEPLLKNKSLAMLFFNASLRTRSSLDIGMQELGGHVITLDVGQGVWDLEAEEGVVMNGAKAEHVKDAAKVLSRYAHALAVRSFPPMKNWAQERKDLTIIHFQKWADIPLINLESSLYHPLQALADAMTIREHLGKLRGVKFLLTWTTHPKPLPMAVPNSAVLMASKLGLDLTLCHPEEFALDDEIMRRVRANAAESGGAVKVTHEFERAFEGQQIVYAKSWGSKNFYGRWEEEAVCRERYAQWTVDMPHMERTDRGKFMHCLPIRRNVVATDAVLDGERAIIYDQAENRMHTQKAALAALVGQESLVRAFLQEKAKS